MRVAYMAPKLRHARDDMQISRVKRTAVAVHDTASSVTPNLHQTNTTARALYFKSGHFVREPKAVLFA